MNRIIAYLRTSTDKQDLQAQKLEILEYAQQNRMQVDDFIAISISSRKSQRARRLEELLDRLQAGDTLLVTELSRLGRSTGEVISLIDGLVANDVRVIVIKQNLTLDQSQDDIQSLAMITLLRRLLKAAQLKVQIAAVSWSSSHRWRYFNEAHPHDQQPRSFHSELGRRGARRRRRHHVDHGQ
jgi:hypothetical protein